MASLNKWIGIGNLGRDPETRTFPSGDQVCNATLAVTEKWKDKQSGEMKEHTGWMRLVFNGRLAEIAAQYLRKGSQIYVEGQIRTRKYTDKDGVEKYATDIRVDKMLMLGSRQGQGAPAGDDDGYSQGGGYSRPPAVAPRAPARPLKQAQHRTPGPSSGFDDMDSDIPF